MGNFAPVTEENDAYLINPMDIRGKTPQDITGVYLRNGPNPKFIPSNGRQHWFDGDSMIHAIRIKDGNLQYSNKYTMTDRMKLENNRGEPISVRVGELQSGMSGLIKTGIHEIQKVLGYKP
jgi:carotenoid cleavage dioxygenase